MLEAVAEYASYVLIAGLVGVAAMLLYPVVRYSRNVQHRRGLIFLALGFVTLAAANAVGFVAEIPFGWGQALSLLSAVFATVGLYDFARPFVQVGTTADDAWATEDATFPTGDADDARSTDERTGGGFETATDDPARTETDGGDDDAGR